MLIAILVVLVLLCGAVVVLFAMMAELWSRLAPLAGAGRLSAATGHLEEARIGAVNIAWPSELAGAPDLARATVIVLSTSCATCRDVSAQLAPKGNGAASPVENLFLVMSCPRAEAGEEFLGRYSLSSIPHLIDVGGAWVSRELGVHTSPSALLFRQGTLEKAFTFASLAALKSDLREMVISEEDTKPLAASTAKA